MLPECFLWIAVSTAVRQCKETNKLGGISAFLACMLIANKALSSIMSH